MLNRERICRVCGYVYPGFMWEAADAPSHGICECCGNQAGLSDLEPSDVKWFQNFWRSTGYKIHGSVTRQIDIKAQFKNLSYKQLHEIVIQIAQLYEVDFLSFPHLVSGQLNIGTILDAIVRAEIEKGITEGVEDLWDEALLLTTKTLVPEHLRIAEYAENRRDRGFNP